MTTNTGQRQAVSTQRLYAIGTVEKFYPKGSPGPTPQDGVGNGGDGDEQAAGEGDSTGVLESARYDVRNDVTKTPYGAVQAVPGLSGAVSGLREGTKVVLARIDGMGVAIVGVRHDDGHHSPVTPGDSVRRLRSGQMQVEVLNDEQDRKVARLAYAPTDGDHPTAMVTVRDDGSLEGASEANDGFCFKADGSFYVSGQGGQLAAGTPGVGGTGGTGGGFGPSPTQTNPNAVGPDTGGTTDEAAANRGAMAAYKVEVLEVGPEETLTAQQQDQQITWQESQEANGRDFAAEARSVNPDGRTDINGYGGELTERANNLGYDTQSRSGGNSGDGQQGADGGSETPETNDTAPDALPRTPGAI